MLQIQLLGHFHVIYQAEPVLIPQARLQSLLGYLALHRHTPQTRQHLSFLFWPEVGEAYARASLRKLVYDLRQAVPDLDALLLIDHRLLKWRDAAVVTVDVAAFSDLLAQAQQTADASAVRAALEQAIARYGGDLLPACYEDWVLRERERLHQQYLGALEQMSRLCAEHGDSSAALAYAQRLVQADPLQESAYRLLMQLHLLGGDRARALRVYHTCATLLADELGVDPGPETQALYQRLLNLEPSPVIHPVPAPQPGVRSLVGRRREWELLLQVWQLAVQAQPRFVVIAGEAGIGKSRLAQELLVWANEQSVMAVQARAYAAEGSLIYAPVLDWLRSETLRPVLARLDPLWLSEIGRLLPELFVQHPGLPRPEPLAEQWQRQRLFEALARAFAAANSPLLLVLDDLQWCDRETLEWLHYLLRFDPKARLLVVGTVRPEEVEPQHALTRLLLNLRSTGQVAEIELDPLNAGDSARLAAQIAERELDAETAKLLYQTTEGNPLFIVETVRASLRGVGSAGEQPRRFSAGEFATLPSKVQAVIQARVAQLSSAARELAQLAATIGRAFTVEVLARAAAWDEDALVRGLDELWQRRIVRELGTHAYDFSHDQLREAAYLDASPARRRLLHRRAAQALEHLYAADLDAVSGQIGAHYGSAGVLEKAVVSYQQAAEVAQRVFAHAEATGYLNKELALLHQLPVTPEHLRQELRLQIALGVSLMVMRGVSAPEPRAAHVRAQALAEQVGDAVERFTTLLAVMLNDLTGARFRAAVALAQPCLALAQSIGDPSLLMEAQGRVGIVELHLGRWRAARDYLEQAAASADYRWDTAVQRRSLQHIGVGSRRHLAMALWQLGYPDQAQEQMNAATALAQAIAHPFTLAAALSWAAWLSQCRREPLRTLALAEQAILLAKQHSFRYWLAHCTVLKGWALAQQGQVEQGIARLQEGLADLTAIDAHLHQPAFLSLLAEVYGQAGQPESGLKLLDEALLQVEASGERFSEAELYRVKGELLHRQGADARAVEAHLLQAMTVARQQEAKSLELRAAMRLAHWWHRQGKRQQAYDQLAPVYDWFTEGFDTPDLREGKALLASLS